MTAAVWIDPESPVPPFEQLRSQLDAQIRSGRLAVGARLPTVRQLAADLALAKNTVVRAYRALERDGLVTGDRRRGTVVLERSPMATERDRVIAAAARRYADEVSGVDATLDDAVSALRAAFGAEG